MLLMFLQNEAINTDVIEGDGNEIEIEIENVCNIYRMRRFTTSTVCAGCGLWALPTMPYKKLISRG
jgi:formate dehydrogenase assembly factor FdhD